MILGLRAQLLLYQYAHEDVSSFDSNILLACTNNVCSNADWGRINIREVAKFAYEKQET